jgi:hypothetical protein
MTVSRQPAAQLPPPKSPLKKPLFYSSIIALVIAGYVTFTLFTRWESTRTIEKRDAVKAAEERRADDQTAIEQLGGSELAIRSLYISPAVVHRGEKAQLCYDVANAKTVRLDPPAGEVWPSHYRCLDVAPTKTTKYTLTITDAKGQSASQDVELKVR